MNQEPKLSTPEDTKSIDQWDEFQKEMEMLEGMEAADLRQATEIKEYYDKHPEELDQ